MTGIGILTEKTSLADVRAAGIQLKPGVEETRPLRFAAIAECSDGRNVTVQFSILAVNPDGSLDAVIAELPGADDAENRDRVRQKLHFCEGQERDLEEHAVEAWVLLERKRALAATLN